MIPPTLNLMKLCQMRGVQGFVPENTVDGEELLWRELLLLGQVVQHSLCIPMSTTYSLPTGRPLESTRISASFLFAFS